MRRLCIILSVVLSVLAACRQQRAVLPRLVELDSLIAVAPDSAVALLESFPADSLLDDENRAYHALLLTQARYKAYIPATNDSTINIAMLHYVDGHDKEKQIRSNLYKGCVFEDLQRLDSAMYYYKSAENLATQSGNTYECGYALMRMAALFQSKYAKKEAIDCYRQSLSCAKEIHNDYDALFALQELGNLYQTVNLDSAFFFTDQAMTLSLQMDSAGYDYDLATLAACYLLKPDYRHCVTIARQAISIATDRISAFRACHWAAQAYAKLGMSDSGMFFLSLAPPPINKADSVLLLRTRGNLEADSVALQKQSGDQADTLLRHEDIFALVHAINDYEKDCHQKSRFLQEQRFIIWISLSIFLLIVLGIITFKSKQRKEKKQFDFINRQNDEINRLSKALEQEIECSRQLRQELAQNEASCQSLLDKISHLSQIISSKEATAKAREELIKSQKEKDSKMIEVLKDEMEKKQSVLNIQREQLNKHQEALSDIVSQQERLIIECYEEGWKSTHGNLHKLHKLMENFFTVDYCKILIASIRALYPRLDRVVSEKEMTNRELMVICMHLAGFQNKIIREFLQVDRDHTVTNIKKDLSKKYLGEAYTLDDLIAPLWDS